MQEFQQKGAPYLLNEMYTLRAKFEGLLCMMSTFGIKDDCLIDELEKIKLEILKQNGPNVIFYETRNQNGEKV